MMIAGREVSIYEVLNGNGRWHWDRRYLTEAEQLADSPPPDEELLSAIEQSLDVKVMLWKTRKDDGIFG